MSEWLIDEAPEAATILAANRAAAEHLVDDIAARGRRSVQWRSFTLGSLAHRLAASELARNAWAPASRTALEALCARVVHRLCGERKLGRFVDVAERPGFARALARTFDELAQNDLSPDRVRSEAPDLAVLFSAYRSELSRAKLADRATLLSSAIHQLGESRATWIEAPLIALDLSIRTRLEADLIAALVDRTPSSIFTLPQGDERTYQRIAERLQLVPEEPAIRDQSELATRLQRSLFSSERARSGSAPGAAEIHTPLNESREAVEIARAVLEEAKRGTRFDRIAVLLRSPELYRAHLSEAFARAQIPARFSSGAKRPDPSGRAFLALLDCATEHLSARAFAEYLSFGQVPDAVAGAPPDALGARERFVPPDDALTDGEELELVRDGIAHGIEDWEEDASVRGGTLRAPRRWEQLLVDAAVIGGADRWKRRLAGLRRQIDDVRGHLEEPSEAREAALDRQLADLDSLSRFAIPLIDTLGAYPLWASWGEWIERLSSLATRALRDPARVLSVLVALSPMAEVGPVGLDEVRAVLTPKLRDESPEYPEPESGRVRVCTIDEARGRSWEVVFVPGLVERVFPAKLVEDPLLLDRVRQRIDPELERLADRAKDERLALRLAVGAASRRVIASIPRLDAERSRPRVPSFYALEFVRAVEGELPSFDALTRRDASTRAARADWPAPEDPSAAIDVGEHDLAFLKSKQRAPRDARRGTAAYLTDDPTLGRALRARWARWSTKWFRQDGLVRSAEAIPILSDYRIAARPYSATALESYAACPYRFYLRAIWRLEPREVPSELEQLDPRQRGTLIHEVQSKLLVELRCRELLPLRAERYLEACAILDEVLGSVESRYREEWAPAILRVWLDAIAATGRDVREWLRRMSEDEHWTPRYFELAFGLRPGLHDVLRDENSGNDPLVLSELGLTLRGAIDLVEERAEDGLDGERRGQLRATDFKTGASHDLRSGMRIAGGEKLQPVLYAMALEARFPDHEVWGGSLYFCTEKGGYTEIDVPLDHEAREAIRQTIGAIDRALESGTFPPAPSQKACLYCDYATVCGPHEARRTKRKEAGLLQDLKKLRRLP